MTRAAWGKAKHEIFTSRKDIVSLLDQGENLETIYQQLIAEKKITLGQRTFRRHAAKIRDEHLGKTKSSKSNPNVNGAPVGEPSAQSPVVAVAGQPATPPLNKHTPATKKAIKHDNDSSPKALDKIWGTKNKSTNHTP